MSDNKSGPDEALRGSVEEVKGKAKEALAEVTGRDDLAREGRAQQDKAQSTRDIAQEEAEAEAARTGAAASRQRQRSSQ